MSGYSQAIAHYLKLKQLFIKQLEELALAKDLETMEFTEQTFFNNLNNVNVLEEFGRVTQLGPLVENIYSQYFDKNTGDVTLEILNLKRLSRGKLKQSLKTLATKLRNYLETDAGLTLSKNIDEAIIRSYGNGGDLGGADLTDLRNRIINVLVKQMSRNKRIITATLNNESLILAGYYHEIAAYLATEKLNSILQASHIGAKNIAADITYTIGQNTSANPIKDYEDSMLALSGTRTFSELVSVDEIFYKDIQTFGNLVKLWSMNFNKARIKGYTISHLQGLLNTFKSQETEQTQYRSVEWFNNNPMAIITTFGPLNVMYFTGLQRWWTSDLISEAVKAKYRLMFNQGKKELTASVKLDLKAYRWKLLINTLP